MERPKPTIALHDVDDEEVPRSVDLPPNLLVVGTVNIDAARQQLSATRMALLNAVGSATEENFYRLQKFGHDEYSVISVLENAANHDREHAEQIRRIVAVSQPS
jgi:hypothetical protein